MPPGARCDIKLGIDIGDSRFRPHYSMRFGQPSRSVPEKNGESK
jgi:hypothetical protein